MQHERIKYQELDAKLKEPSKILDEDLENKIKQLESQNPKNPEDGDKDDRI